MNPEGANIQKERRAAGQGAILLCAVFWSTSGLFIKLVDWHPVLIAGSRSFLAAVFLLVLRRFSRRWPEAARPLSLAASGLWYAATMILFVIANKLTASANAILLQYTAPVWACLLGWLFLREKPAAEQWGGLGLVSLGMFLVFKSGLSGGSLLGDALALLSGLTFAANSVALRMRKDGRSADVMLCSHIITALFAAPFFFRHPPPVSPGSAVSILFMGIVQIGAASALFAYGIRSVPAAQAMLTAAIEPVLNPVWVLAVTGEKPGLSVISGGALIVAGVVFSSIVGKWRGIKNRPGPLVTRSAWRRRN